MKIELNPPSPLLRKFLAGATCVLAYMIMASIFSPDRTRAGTDPLPGIPPKSIEYPSADPHEGLRSLGVIEDRGYSIHIFATDGGPRYTIYENSSGREIGVLLSQEQIHRGFPELQLPAMEFDASSPLMMVGPDLMDCLDRGVR